MKNPGDAVSLWAGRVRVLQRPDRYDPVKLAEARRNLSEARVERAILDAIAADPPLTVEQRERLAELLTEPRLLTRVIEVLHCPACLLARDFLGAWRHTPSCPTGRGRAVSTRGLTRTTTTTTTTTNQEETP